MGKKQHQKDRLYLTAKEHKEEWGGYKEKKRAPFAKLPFNCCAISFTPYTDPVCTDDGIIYDITNAVPFIRKFGRHPVKGTPLTLADLVKLNIHKNADGEYACPVTGKVFTEHTHIVALRPTGNVYAWDAINELCLKPRCLKDLLTDEAFSRKDVITLQDPLNVSGRLISEFAHVKQELAVEEPEEAAAGASLRNVTDDMKRALGALGTAEAADALARGGGGKRAEAMRLLADAKLRAASGAAAGTSGGGGGGGGSKAGAAGAGGQQQGGGGGSGAGGGGAGDWRLRAPERRNEMPSFKPGAGTWDSEDQGLDGGAKGGKGGKRKGGGGDKAGSAKESADGGKANPKEWYEAAGHVKYKESMMTTGAMSRGFTSTVGGSVTVNERQVVRLERNPTKKGYVRLHTNLGDLNLELHCDIAPRTTENFLALCEMGYYDDVKFHRSIKNFMIQGGDPTGTGKGGTSIYGPTFKDELDSRLLHVGRGVLSSANSGPNTNGSQFFILFKSARHLDYKHSVFGRVVGGLDVLSAMERVATDDDDRPTADVVITGVTVFTNPFREMEEAEAAEAEAARKKAEGLAPDDPDAERSTWYSNPGASNASAPVRAGVGRYISSVLLDAPPAAKPGAPASAKAAAPPAVAGVGSKQAAPPAAKKAKAGHQYGNFDAW